MLYLVTGINGVGKSKFIRKLLDHRRDFSHIQGSSRLMERLGIDQDDYEKLRNFDETAKKESFGLIMLEANEKYGSSLSEHAIIDGHVLNIRNGKVVRIIDNDELRLFSAVIYLYAPADNIIRRIKKDARFRNRAVFGNYTEQSQKELILNEYQEQIEEALEDSGLGNKALFKIPHLENKTDDAVAIFEEIHQRILIGREIGVKIAERILK